MIILFLSLAGAGMMFLLAGKRFLCGNGKEVSVLYLIWQWGRVKWYLAAAVLAVGMFLLYIGRSNELLDREDNSALADESSRERVYVDAFPGNAPLQRFQYAWTANKYISHAFGGIDGKAYTNSLEAFQENYEKGHRVFEVDLRLTADGKLAAAHDLPCNDDGQSMTLKEFKEYKIMDRYTSLSFEDIVYLMEQYPDFYLVTDTKETRSPYIETQFHYMVRIANEIAPEVLTRIIPQIYNEEMFYTIMDIYNWRSMIYTLYALKDFSEEEVVDFACREGIRVVTVNSAKAKPLLCPGG